jgi:hypothetical protein
MYIYGIGDGKKRLGKHGSVLSPRIYSWLFSGAFADIWAYFAAHSISGSWPIWNRIYCYNYILAELSQTPYNN